jgi:HemY protein
MKRLILAFLVLFFAVGLGYLMHRDPGYILITYRTWSIETSLWVGTTILTIAFLLLYFLLRLFSHTTKLASYLSIWHKERRERKAGKQTNQAFEALIEMRWRDAENTLIKSAKHSTIPVINYTAAAYAAQQLGHADRRDDHLNQLNTTEKITKLIKAHFYIKSQQWQSALNILRPLQDRHANDPAVLQCLAQTLMALNEWSAIKVLLPKISKIGNTPAATPFNTQLYSKLLRHASDSQWLDNIWKTTPKCLKTTATVVTAYAKKCHQFGITKKGLYAIESAAKKNCHRDLVTAYGQIIGDNLQHQIRQAESWLQQGRNEPATLLCLGRLCLEEKLWGKARDYLTRSIKITNAPAAHYELGKLHNTLGDAHIAITHYQQAASLLSEHLD